MIKYIPLISAVVTIVFTAFVSTPGSPLLINGMTQADISNMYPNAITPAGITFSIWTLIYISWIVAGIFIAGLHYRFMKKSFILKIHEAFTKMHLDKKFVISYSSVMFLTGIWLIPWGYNMIGLALIVMFLILATLVYTFIISRDMHPMVR